MEIFYMLLAINLLAFIVIARDKVKAIKRLSRTPEKFFFFLALIGGSLGIYSGMAVFRHKTKHKKFAIGIPLIILAQLAILYFIFAPYILLLLLK